jgi:hypothetical protein
MNTGKLKILWVLVAVAGVIMGMMALMVPLGNVHTASRTNKRLSDLDQAAPGFAPTVAQYRDGCTDAKYLWDAMGTMMAVGFTGGGAIVVLALIGLWITSGIQRKQINAQQSAPPLPRAPAGHSEGAR